MPRFSNNKCIIHINGKFESPFLRELYSRIYSEFGTLPFPILYDVSQTPSSNTFPLEQGHTYGDGGCLRKGADIYEVLERMQDTWR